MWVMRIRKSWWLFDVYDFREITIEECIRYIKLTDVPLLTNGKSEQNVYRGHFNDWTKCFNVIKPHLLTEALDNEEGFVMFDSAIRVRFEAIDPFVAEDMYSRLVKDKNLGAISK